MAEHLIPVKVVDYPDLRQVVLCRDCRADGEKDVRPVEQRKGCRNLLDYESLFECSNCGWTSSDTYTADPMRYCPGCGARITENAKSGGGSR